MTDIADAVRFRTNSFDKMDIETMVQRLKEQYMVNTDIDIMPEQDDEEWVRPSDWPDLDSLNLEFTGDTDFIYMTYKCGLENTAILWYLEPYNNETVEFSIGSIENGSFVPSETLQIQSASNIAYNPISEMSGYVVARLTGKINKIYTINFNFNNGAGELNGQKQPMVERIAYIPNVRQITQNSSATGFWGTHYLERDKVINGDGSNLTTMSYAWDNCVRLRSLDISHFYTTRNVTTLSSVFARCTFLRELDLRHWDVSNVTNLNSAFCWCRKLKRLNLTGWDISKVTNTNSTFNECASLPKIDGIDSFDTQNVGNAGNMFSNCYCLTELPVSNFDTHKMTTITGIFANCYKLTELDLSKWDISNVTSLSGTFSYCRNLKKLNITGWTNNNKITNVSNMFSNCNSLQSVDISGLQIGDNCTNIYQMFSGCWSIKRLDFPATWDMSGISSSNNTFTGIFYNCYSLETITGIKDWQLSFENAAQTIFYNCYSLKDLDVSGWKTDTITNMNQMFANCFSLKSLDLSGWDVSNVTNMNSMFLACHSLTTIGNIDNWDTSKCNTFSGMFQGCKSLLEMPNIANWDMSKATTVSNMFQDCHSIEEANIRNLNLAECTQITQMFRYCFALKSVDFTGWSIPKLTSSAPGSFLGDCWALEDVKVFAIPISHSYANDFCLTHESLINIIDSLPVVTSTKTLALSNMNLNLLTAEEKQVATNKGWSLIA